MAAKKKAARKKAPAKAPPAEPAAPEAPPPAAPARPKAPPKARKAGKKAAPPAPARRWIDEPEEEDAFETTGRASDEAIEPRYRAVEAVLPPLPPLPPRAADGTITLAVGTGTVQAFMLQGLLDGKVDTEDRTYAVERLEYDALDAVARAGARDVVLIPFGAYPRLRQTYLLLPSGASFGDQRGPLLATRRPIRWSEVEQDGLQVAVPGVEHSGTLLLRLWLPKARFELLPMSPRQVVLMVRTNQVRSGLLVDEEQVTYREFHLMGIQDLGRWWGERTEGLPLPLSALGVRRDLPAELRSHIQLDLKRSIAYALGHKEDTIERIAAHAPKHTPESVDAYVQRYVNDLSLHCGERGRQAVSLFYEQCVERGALAEAPEPVFHGDEVQ